MNEKYNSTTSVNFNSLPEFMYDKRFLDMPEPLQIKIIEEYFRFVRYSTAHPMTYLTFRNEKE